MWELHLEEDVIKFWKPSQRQCSYRTLTDRCVNSVSHTWIWFNLFILPSEGICFDIWCRHFHELHKGWQQAPQGHSSLFRGRTEVLRPHIISTVKSKESTVSETVTFDLKLRPVTDKRERLSFTLPWSWSNRLSLALFSSLFLFTNQRQTSWDRLLNTNSSDVCCFYANVGLIVLRRLLDSLFIH